MLSCRLASLWLASQISNLWSCHFNHFSFVLAVLQFAIFVIFLSLALTQPVVHVFNLMPHLSVLHF